MSPSLRAARRPWRVEDEVDLRVVALAPSSGQPVQPSGCLGQLRIARLRLPAHARVGSRSRPARSFRCPADMGRSSPAISSKTGWIQHVLWQALRDDTRIVLHYPASVAATESDERRRT